MREKEAPNNAGEGAWQCRDDDERVEPGLEVDDDHEVDQQHGKCQSTQKLHVGATHRRSLASHVHGRASWQLRIHLLYDLGDLIVHSTEVTPLVADEDIDRGED